MNTDQIHEYAVQLSAFGRNVSTLATAIAHWADIARARGFNAREAVIAAGAADECMEAMQRSAKSAEAAWVNAMLTLRTIAPQPIDAIPSTIDITNVVRVDFSLRRLS